MRQFDAHAHSLTTIIRREGKEGERGENWPNAEEKKVQLSPKNISLFLEKNIGTFFYLATILG